MGRNELVAANDQNWYGDDMRYDYTDGERVKEFSFPMGEAPNVFTEDIKIEPILPIDAPNPPHPPKLAVTIWRRLYGVPEFMFEGGRSAFHNSTLEADRKHQRDCMLDAGVPPEAIQPEWQKDYAGPV